MAEGECPSARITKRVKEAQRFPVKAFRLIEGTAEVVRFAEIVQVRRDHLLIAHGTPESETVAEPLDRLRETSRRRGQEAKPVKRVRLTGEITRLPKEGKPLEQLRLGPRVVPLQLTSQAEVEERTGGACRIAGTLPGLQ